MPSITIVETTGTQLVVGPDNIQNFIVSGSHSGDNVVVNATGAPTVITVDVVDSPSNVSITGVSNPQNISITVEEGVRPTSLCPLDTAFLYNSSGQLVQTISDITTDFTYNSLGKLVSLIRPAYRKDFYYSGDFLTGVDVIKSS